MLECVTWPVYQLERHTNQIAERVNNIVIASWHWMGEAGRAGSLRMTNCHQSNTHNLSDQMTCMHSVVTCRVL